MCGSEILPAGGNTFLEFTRKGKTNNFFSLLLLHLPLLLCGLSKQGSVLCLQYAVLAVDFLLNRITLLIILAIQYVTVNIAPSIGRFSMIHMNGGDLDGIP